MSEYFYDMYVRVPCACLVPSEVRRRHWMPWNWSYRWSLTYHMVPSCRLSLPFHLTVMLELESGHSYTFRPLEGSDLLKPMGFKYRTQRHDVVMP